MCFCLEQLILLGEYEWRPRTWTAYLNTNTDACPARSTSLATYPGLESSKVPYGNESSGAVTVRPPTIPSSSSKSGLLSGVPSSSPITNIGDYVAQGLGISSVTASSANNVEESVASTPSQHTGSRPSRSTTVELTIVGTGNRFSISTLSSSLTTTNPTIPFAAAADVTPAFAANATKGFNFTAGTICADDSCAIACDGLWQTWTTASSRFSTSYAALHGRVTVTTTTPELISSKSTSISYPSNPWCIRCAMEYQGSTPLYRPLSGR